MVATEAEDMDVADRDLVPRVGSRSRGAFAGGLTTDEVFNLELRRTGAPSSPFGSIDLRSRPVCRGGTVVCGVSAAVFFALPARGRFIAGGRFTTGSGLVGVIVGVLLLDRNVDWREGIKAEMRFGNGRREGAGRVGWGLMAGKVVSAALDGVSQGLGLPSIGTRGNGARPPTSGVNKLPLLLPLVKGLSCRRAGIPGISDAELRGMGLGERVGGREVYELERWTMGFGNKLSREGGAPDVSSGSSSLIHTNRYRTTPQRLPTTRDPQLGHEHMPRRLVPVLYPCGIVLPSRVELLQSWKPVKESGGLKVSHSPVSRG